MQYGAEVFPYYRVEKINNEKQGKKQKNVFVIVKLLTYFIISFLVSRVLLINGMAPFGIAFLAAALYYKNKKISLIMACGTLVGYVSLYNNVKSIGIYVLITITLTILICVCEKLSKTYWAVASFTTIFLEFFLYNMAISNMTAPLSLLNSFFEIVCIFPLYFILDYSILCFKDLKTKHLFTNEELISMAVAISLMISGTWGVTMFGISLRNILALALILMVGYTSGSAVGAASGVALGAIVGMSSNNMMYFISMYGLCGLIVGIFKETGKWISGISFLISFCILKIYSDAGQSFKIVEALISCAIFLFIPGKIYANIGLELNWKEKQDDIGMKYVNKVRNIFVDRLNNFSDVLYNMSSILNNLVDNDKLAIKNKSAMLIENLADRVCSNCPMNSICWKREIHYTYGAFEELIQNYQENRNIIPKEIDRKCTNRTQLLKATEDIVNHYIIKEMWRNRLSEGRELLAGQINNMAGSVKEIVEEFDSDIQIDNVLDRNLSKLLEKNNIKIKELICIKDKKDRSVIKMSLKACGGSQKCIKEILPIINEVTGKCMSVSDEGCKIDVNSGNCNITFEETPKYHVSTYVGGESKAGEKHNGDSYSFGKLLDGSYMTLISDGMGSGPQAEHESRAAVELIEKFTSAGFSKETAINTVNSIMTLKFSEEEKFSTIDLSSIDLYTGEVDFMKVGAVASFIKSDNKIKIVDSKTLPIGVLDKADIEINKNVVKNGDIIIMLSDGVLDYNNEDLGNTEWIEEYLRNNNFNNPKDIAEGIIVKAKELNGGKVKDDITVIASKIYGLY